MQISIPFVALLGMAAAAIVSPAVNNTVTVKANGTSIYPTLTSTLTTTRVFTVTACPPTVTSCPVGKVTTEVHTVVTTFCPGKTSQPVKPTIPGRVSASPVPPASACKNCTTPVVSKSTGKATTAPVVPITKPTAKANSTSAATAKPSTVVKGGAMMHGVGFGGAAVAVFAAILL